MYFLVKLFYAVLLVWMGYLILKYRRTVKSWTGNFVWAERYLWNGGTYLVLIFIGCFLIILWILYPFWWLSLIFWNPAIGDTTTNSTIH